MLTDRIMSTIWITTWSAAWLITLGFPRTRKNRRGAGWVRSGTRRAVISSALFTLALILGGIYQFIVTGSFWLNDAVGAGMLLEAVWYSTIVLSHHIGFRPTPFRKLHLIAWIWLFGGELGRRELKLMAKAKKALAS